MRLTLELWGRLIEATFFGDNLLWSFFNTETF